MKWRTFATDPAFQEGINWLRLRRSPGIPHDASAEQKFEAAVGWNAYQLALTDVATELMRLNTPQSSLDEPPIRS